MKSLETPNVDDFSDIVRLYHKFQGDNWVFPSLDHSLTDAVVKDGNKIIGYGVLSTFSEALMVLDMNEQAKDRAQALDMLMIAVKEWAKKYNMSEIYAFIRDSGFSMILQKHYGFRRCTGDPLVLDIR